MNHWKLWPKPNVEKIEHKLQNQPYEKWLNNNIETNYHN